MAASVAAAAGRRICAALLIGETDECLASAFGDENLVDEAAGPRASLVRASRWALERGVEELALCEILSALWHDPAWRQAWESGEAGLRVAAAKELEKQCPLRQIVGNAKCVLSYGDIASRGSYHSHFAKLTTHAAHLCDDTRTRTYQRAILSNRADFEGKIVMDVGSGSGILAYFALQAGATKVYCVEATRMARVITRLAEANGWSDKIVVINKMLQEIRDEIPERVDCILSETLGQFLFAERGIETVAVARERFLKPGGKLFPTKVSFCLAPFTDHECYSTRISESKYFWTNSNFCGVDLSSVEALSREEIFQRPLHDQFHPDQLKADAHTEVYDFCTMRPEQLINFEINFATVAKTSCSVHGIAGWFEVHFEGSSCDVILSTSPWDDLTMWWQTRLMLPYPLEVTQGQEIICSVGFAATDAASYDCRLVMEANGVRREQGGLGLDNLDKSHQRPKYVRKQISDTHATVEPDWKGTRPQPTASEVLVSDPFKKLKLALAAAPMHEGSHPVESEGAPREPESHALPQVPPSAASVSETMQVKLKQLTFNNVDYVYMDEPALCAPFVQPHASLTMVACDGKSVFMTPQEKPYSCLVQYCSTGEGLKPNFWMEKTACIEHMCAVILRHQASDPETLLTEEQLGGFSLAYLFGIYANYAGLPARR